MKITKYDQLPVVISDSNQAAGRAAAADFAAFAQQALVDTERIAVILATGNSQLAFIKAATEHPDIDWSRITVLHMDEYLGMDDQHPASFRRWMREHVQDKVLLGAFEGILGDYLPAQDEVTRYSKLLRDLDPVICVMGIGENGHLAFNDPPADFQSENLVRIVEMDEVSRRQQVGEGHFASLDETPTHAMSLTIPALLRPKHVLVVTPESRKAAIVRLALQGPITQDVPASYLRTQPHAKLYLDKDSAALLD